MAIKINGVTVIDDSQNGNLAGQLQVTGNISGGNVSGTLVAGTLTTAAQPNVTSVGTLTSLAVTGNVLAGNVSGTNVTGTLTTAAQPNVTSVGTLTSLAVTGNITSGNVSGTTGAFTTVTGNGRALTSLNASDLDTGTVPAARLSGTYTITVSGSATTAGTVTTAAQPNITSVGTLTSLAVTGNITSGNVSGTTGTFTNVGGTLTTAAQPNVTSVGTLTSLAVTGNVSSGNLSTTRVNATYLDAGNIEITGDTITSAHSVITIDPSTAGAAGLVVIAGNLQVTGTTTTVDSTTVTVNDLAINVANNAATAAAANDGGIKVGPVGAEYATWVYNQASGAWSTGLGITATGNIAGGNVSGTNGTFTNVGGNGATLTNINASNIASGTLPAARLSGSYTINISGSATTAGTVTTAAQPNITSVGTLTALSVTGNVTAGNLSATNLTGTLTTAAQPNVTSVGTLTSLAVTGNVSSGNLSGTTITGTTFSGTNGSFTNVSGNGSALTAINASNIATGTLAQARLANASLTVNGVAIALGSSGTVTANTPNSVTFNNGGAGSASGTAFNGSAAVTVSHNTIGAAPQAGNASIVTVGALNSGSITSGFGSIDIGTDTVTCGGIINANATGVGNIGSATVAFNTVFAKATSAQYADLAEMYEADGNIEPGTVVMFGGSKEVTVCNDDASKRIAGVISTNPSYIMNSGLDAEYVVAVALQGRVPVKVTGRVRKGDMMVSAGNGRARAEENPAMGTVIGKALADFDGIDGVIEVVIGRI